jgi:hypothetical protein
MPAAEKRAVRYTDEVGRILGALTAGMLVMAAASAQTPAGWKVLKDKEGACKLAVPQAWTVNQQLPHMAMAPDRSDATVMSHMGKAINPIPDVVQHALGVDRMLENTPQRIFWAAKPMSYKGGPPMVSYHVTVSVRGGACEARIALKVGSGDGLAKRIAATLSSAR